MAIRAACFEQRHGAERVAREPRRDDAPRASRSDHNVVEASSGRTRSRHSGHIIPVRSEPDRREESGGPAAAELRIGLVGCGEVCEHKHLPALQRVRGARVVAAADTDAARVNRVADRYGIPSRFASVQALLEAGVVDVVGVLVPPAQHAQVALPAMNAGAHVLVEKPLTLTLDEADTLVAAAQHASGHVLMGFHMRWHRLMVAAREAMRVSMVGNVEGVRAVWNSPRPDAGIPDWKRRRASGGGALVELAVHLFDLWRVVLGTEIVEVFVLSRNGQRQDESAVISARLANGTLATATISERTSHNIELEIFGDRGRLVVSGQRFDGFEYYGVKETGGMLRPRLRNLVRTARELPRGLARMRSLGDYGDSYRAQWQHFVDVITQNVEPQSALMDGHAALRAVLAAAASASRGEPVLVADAPRSIHQVHAGG